MAKKRKLYICSRHEVCTDEHCLRKGRHIIAGEPYVFCDLFNGTVKLLLAAELTSEEKKALKEKARKYQTAFVKINPLREALGKAKHALAMGSMDMYTRHMDEIVRLLKRDDDKTGALMTMSLIEEFLVEQEQDLRKKFDAATFQLKL